MRLETFCGVQGLYRVIDRKCIVSFTKPQRHPFSVKMEAPFTSEGAGGGEVVIAEGSLISENFFENRLYIVLVIVIFIVILIKE